MQLRCGQSSSVNKRCFVPFGAVACNLSVFIGERKRQQRVAARETAQRNQPRAPKGVEKRDDHFNLTSLTNQGVLLRRTDDNLLKKVLLLVIILFTVENGQCQVDHIYVSMKC